MASEHHPRAARPERKYPTIPTVYRLLVDWFRVEGQADLTPERLALEFMRDWCPSVISFGPIEEIEKLARDQNIARRLDADSSIESARRIGGFHGMSVKDVRQLAKAKAFNDLADLATVLPRPQPTAIPPVNPVPCRSPAAILSQLMADAKLSDSHAARQLLVSRSTVSLVRRGKILPSRKLAERLGKRFNLPAALFVFGDAGSASPPRPR